MNLICAAALTYTPLSQDFNKGGLRQRGYITFNDTGGPNASGGGGGGGGGGVPPYVWPNIRAGGGGGGGGSPLRLAKYTSGVTSKVPPTMSFNLSFATGILKKSSEPKSLRGVCPNPPSLRTPLIRYSKVDMHDTAHLHINHYTNSCFKWYASCVPVCGWCMSWE